MELGDPSFCWSLPLIVECRYVYYAPHPLLRGSLHLVRDQAAEKELDIAI